jgi:hypothetical protein
MNDYATDGPNTPKATAPAAVDPILFEIFGADAAHLAPDLAARAAAALRFRKHSAINATDVAFSVESARYNASRRGLAETVGGLLHDHRREIVMFDHLLSSIYEASREDGSWAEALCMIGSEWVSSLLRGINDFQPRMDAAIATVRAEDDGEVRA